MARAPLRFAKAYRVGSGFSGFSGSGSSNTASRGARSCGGATACRLARELPTAVGYVQCTRFERCA